MGEDAPSLNLPTWAFRRQLQQKYSFCRFLKRKGFCDYVLTPLLESYLALE